MSDREYDILLWGATGWTGIHLVEYFAEQYPLDSDSGIRWAICARSSSKMRKVIDRIKRQGHGWADDIECIQVDNTDFERVSEVASKSRVVATVAGPFQKFGENLVKACVEGGTHYCDITGEAVFIKKMIKKYHADAEKKGVYIVNCCGFDSIPSDLGVFTAVDYIHKELNQKCTSVNGYITGSTPSNLNEHDKKNQGGGGTISSLLNALGTDLQSIYEPYYLTGKDDKNRADAYHFPRFLLGFQNELGEQKYTSHFLMGVINEKIVRRSNYLLGHKYGKNFSYHEGLATSSLMVGIFAGPLFLLAYLFLMIGPVRDFLKKRLPQPSTFPPDRPENFKPGSFEFKHVAKTNKGATVLVTVQGVGDGGWAETSKMLGESAMTLLNDQESFKEESGVNGGIVTAAILGSPLLQRLRAKGMTFHPELLSE